MQTDQRIGGSHEEVTRKRTRDDYDDHITQNRKSGKWSADEEELANLLIEEFQRGSLSDCDDGCTLRSYLANKLSCAPMRVSKKFSKGRIGKLTFTKRELSPGSSSLSEIFQARIRELERSILADNSSNSATSSQTAVPSLETKAQPLKTARRPLGSAVLPDAQLLMSTPESPEVLDPLHIFGLETGPSLSSEVEETEADVWCQILQSYEK